MSYKKIFQGVEKLDSIEESATADQTDAEILTAFESETGRDVSDDGEVIDSIPSQINPLALSQGVQMTGVTSGSNGIQIANNDDINFGTGDFSLVWVGSLPDWTPSTGYFLLTKDAGNANGYGLYIRGGGKLSIYMNNVSLANASTIVNTIPDGDCAVIVCVCVRETATTAGSMTYYVNDVKLGDTITLAAETPTTVSNISILYTAGTHASRTASTTLATYTYNRALDADDVSYLYKYGVHPADRWGSMTSLATGNNYTFSDDVANATEFNSTYTVQVTSAITATVASNVLAIVSGGIGKKGLTFTDFTTNSQVRVNFNITAISETWYLYDYDGANLIVLDTITSVGVYDAVLTFSGGYGLRLFTETLGGSITIDGSTGFNIIPLGATLALEPENIQLSPGQWLDAANNHHAKLPEEGTSLIRPQSDGEIRWTNTWAASSAGQYLGGINEDIFPSDKIRIEWISIQTATTGVNITIGDQTDTDRYVESVALAEEMDISSPAHRNHDGTNLKLVITPSGTYTGSITTVIKYTLI